MIGVETINQPININTKESFLSLGMGIYDVYIIGGWYVDLGKFSLLLRRTNTNKIIEPVEYTFKSDSHYKNLRAKRIFSFVINKGGEFKLDFKNPNSIIVKKRSLLLGYFFGKQFDTQNIQIIIERQ